MDEEREKYIKDPRIPCKYGANCYQKNPTHHVKYKHPPKKRPGARGNQGPNKRLKTTDDNGLLSNVAGNQSRDKVTSAATSTDVTEETNESMLLSTVTEEGNKESKNIDVEKNENIRTENGNGVPKYLPKDFGRKDFINSKFLVDMPDDFYTFWEFCKGLKESNPLEALKPIGLNLVGPFDVLAGKFDGTLEKSKEQYLLHWRFYFDPPEFQTILTGNSSGYHIGYFRDLPTEMPVFLAENSAAKNGEFTEIGENIFAAVYIFLDSLLKTADPFKKMTITRYINLVKKEADKHNFDLAKKSPTMKKRDKNAVAKSFNTLGIVVPYEKKSEQGYRELALSNKELKKVFEKLRYATGEERDHLMTQLQPVLTYASIATDECDFGTGLELGLDILFFGVDFLNSTAKKYLSTAYKLLNRSEFALVAEAHMNNRKTGYNLSII